MIYLLAVNIYVSDEIKERWVNYEFLGKPIKLRDGNTYMRVHSKFFNVTHFYCFETDFIWFDKEDFMSQR